MVRSLFTTQIALWAIAVEGHVLAALLLDVALVDDVVHLGLGAGVELLQVAHQ